MARTRVKICGICRPQDALAAATAGADAVGLVFHPASARCLSLDEAAAIIRVLPPLVMSVGLFVDAETDAIRLAAHTLSLSCIQLHGHEPLEQVQALAPLPVLKAVRADRSTLHDELAALREGIARRQISNLRGLLLETASKSAPGGTGQENDWQFIREAQADGWFRDLPAILVAGGLTPENVGSVVRLLRPWAVDVSSGVEEGRRAKSIHKIDQLVREVRDADRSLAEPS